MSLEANFRPHFEIEAARNGKVFCTQYQQKDWHQCLCSVVHADVIMDRIFHNTVWVETGSYNMREHTALTTT